MQYLQHIQMQQFGKFLENIIESVIFTAYM